MRAKYPTNKCANTSACQDTGGALVISTTDSQCDSHACQHNCHLLVSEKCIIFKKFLVLLKPPDGHSLLVALIRPSHWPALNIQKSLGGCTGKAHRIKVRKSCRPVDWTSMSCSLSIESLSQVLFGNTGKMSCCSITRELHVLSFLKTHTFQE